MVLLLLVVSLYWGGNIAVGGCLGLLAALLNGASGWEGSAGVFATGIGGGGGLISVPCGSCEGFVLESAGYLRFSVNCNATYIY